MGDICKILIQNGFRFIPHLYTISTLVCLKRFFLKFYKDFASFDYCDFGRHLLHPQILRLLVLLKPADFEAQSSSIVQIQITNACPALVQTFHSLMTRKKILALVYTRNKPCELGSRIQDVCSPKTGLIFSEVGG